MIPARKVLSHFFLSSTSSLLVIVFLHISHGTTLDLPVGFSHSVFAAVHSYGNVIKAHSAADGHSFFVPFLLSSTFVSTNSFPGSVGFALGFLFLNGSRVKVAPLPFDRQRLDDGIYLAVCSGMSGNGSNLIKERLAFITGVHDGGFHASSSVVADGYVVPVWVANSRRPLKSVNASLVIVATGDGIQNNLQLQDYDGKVVWSVSTASMMEIQDTGNLVVYSSPNRTHVMWQSNTEPVDTLLQGQKLLVGMELTSTSGDYAAQMEKGGMVLVLKNLHLAEEQSCPYWIFPIHFRNDSYLPDGRLWLNPTDQVSMNSLIYSSPCTGSNLDAVAYSMLGNASLKFFLEAGLCSNDPSFKGARKSVIVTGRDDDFPISWTFLRMDNDGRLYIIAVIMNNSTAIPGTPGTLRYAFDNEEAGFTVEKNVADASILLQAAAPFAWGECDVPLACGSLGVCTAHASRLCSCPSSVYFKPIDIEDPSQGCMRLGFLPDCTNQVYRDTEKLMFDFLEMENTSSILLFSQWEYISQYTTVELCKKACSINCSCIGFFYRKESLTCFFVNSSKLSLVHSDPFSGYSLADLGMQGYTQYTVLPSDYSTYLRLNTTYVVESGSGSGLDNRDKILIVLFASLAALLLSIVLFGWYMTKRNRWRIRRIRQIEEEELRDILPLLPSRYSFKELEKATNGFHNLLGAGGCGSVYAGSLSDGRKVAVKVLESLMQSGQSKQFLAEVATVGRTNHLNVVRLVGFCWEVSHRLLVYEFVERGSLDRWLFTKGSDIARNGLPTFLDWPTRYNVALGIARGLSYLHDDCAQPVLHFDIKPQNILLDEAFEAKLADFGMSRLIQRDVSKVVTGVRGTPGYIAPEWLAHGAVSKKSDVYSMGMVFLEIIGGRKNVDLALMDLDSGLLNNVAMQEAWHFPSWASKKCEQGLMTELVDKRLLACGFDAEQVQKLIHTAFWCIQDDPSVRPNAATVLQWLEGDFFVKQPPFNLSCTKGYSRSGSFMSLS
ncbi:hypothetical protein L7F22_014652 [Adiantum nelumboides]|nr:hypothetical protein [Adiantum nelumboides]